MASVLARKVSVLMSPPTQKRCSRCRETKPTSEFHRRNAQDGFQAYCKPCQYEIGHARSDSYRARRNELAKKDYRANPEKFYWRNVERKYGITKDEYDAFLERQDGACAICLNAFPADPLGDRKTQRRIYVDHDHTTGAVRGLLCPACNTAVGLMKDDPENARRLAGYLLRAIATV